MLVVPFGPRRILGVVVEVAEDSELPPERLAEPVSALEADVPPDLVRLGLWVAEEYVSTPARGLALVLPPGTGTGSGRRTVARRSLVAALTDAGEEALAGAERLSGGQRVTLEALADGPLRVSALAEAAGCDHAGARRLERRGLVSLERTIEPSRRPELRGVGALRRVERPTAAQEAALAVVVARWRREQTGRSPPAAARRHRLGQDRGLPEGRGRGASPRAHGDRAGARDRPHASDGSALRGPLRRHRGDPAFAAVGARALRRMVPAALGRGQGVRGAAVGRVRPAGRCRADRGRRGARRLLQAGGRSRVTTRAGWPSAARPAAGPCCWPAAPPRAPRPCCTTGGSSCGRGWTAAACRPFRWWAWRGSRAHSTRRRAMHSRRCAAAARRRSCCSTAAAGRTSSPAASADVPGSARCAT